MRLTGEYTFDAPRETVWEILNDPEVLKKHMPGCEKLEPLGDDQYEAVISLGVSAIKGTYKAKLDIRDKVAPESYSLHVDGSGKPGFVKGSGNVTLEDHGGQTRLKYDGEFQIGGMIARVGQRMVKSVADRLTRQFFQELGGEAEQRK